MKLKSITFDCPILFRGNFSFIEEVHAPELNSFINSATYNKSQSYLVVVDHNNSQYVIDVIENVRKNDKGYSKHLKQLRNFLQATVSIIKATLNEDATYSFETMQSSVYKLTGLSISEEILQEFPKLNLLSSFYNIREYNENNINYNVNIPPWTNAKYVYFVILPFKDTQYIIANYTKRAKAINLINKAELHNAFVVEIERSFPDSDSSNPLDDDTIEEIPIEDLKSISVADLDSLL